MGTVSIDNDLVFLVMQDEDTLMLRAGCATLGLVVQAVDFETLYANMFRASQDLLRALAAESHLEAFLDGRDIAWHLRGRPTPPEVTRFDLRVFARWRQRPSTADAPSIALVDRRAAVGSWA